MSRNFWQWYIFFFLYIFPLFFSYAGGWSSGAWTATISLMIGIIGWAWLIKVQFRKHVSKPKLLLKEAQELQRSGKVVDAKINEIITKKETKEGNFMTEVMVSFPNLAGTEITTSFDFLDSKPHLKRYEVGKQLPLRLNTQKSAEIPWILGEGDYFATKSKMRWLYLFTIVYAIAVFIVNHLVFSNGKGWRWLSLWHPWVWTPYFGLITELAINKIFSRMGGGLNHKSSYELFLHGLETKGYITKINQTGTFINEQPEMRIHINYTDKDGKTHYLEKKKVVLLSDIHAYQVGEVKLLYLPDKPDIIEFI